jgi:hypothetical protein
VLSQAAGGTIEMARVCGNLAVSRSLGDYTYKDRADLQPEEQKISAEADMTVLERKVYHTGCSIEATCRVLPGVDVWICAAKRG